MLLLLFLLSVSSSECGAQYYVYGEGPPPLAAYRRAPVRRAASPMEALERLRSARYLPPVEYSDEFYQDEFALRPQWTSDEETYEYYAPAYGTQEDPEEVYNEWKRNYLIEQQQVQRRSDVMSPSATPTKSSSPPPQVTGIPPSPEKKSVQSLVVADPPLAAPSREEGQKEEPLFRPQQTSQRTTAWKNNKTPIPLLKQMIQGGQKKDVLLEELNSLKKV